VVSFALGFGHWATGAADVVIDGHVIQGEPRRATGSTPTRRCGLTNPVGGSVSFYDTHVRLEAIA